MHLIPVKAPKPPIRELVADSDWTSNVLSIGAGDAKPVI